MGMSVDQARQQRRAAQIEHARIGRCVRLHLRWRTDLLDPVVLDPHCCE